VNYGPGDPGETGDRPDLGEAGDDDEPTLETGPGAAIPPDEEPTLETEASGGSEDPTTESEPVDHAGWASRIERMAESKKERRRRLLSTVGLAAVPVVLLLLIAVILLSVYGGLGGEDEEASTTTTLSPVPPEGSALMIVEEGSTLAFVVVLHPWDSGGVVLGVPGLTLLENDGVFETLDQIYAGERRDRVKEILSEEVDMPLGPAVAVEWSELQIAMRTALVDGAPNGALTMEEGEALVLAQVVRAFVGEYVSDLGLTAWVELRMTGEATEVRQAVSVDADSMSANVWTAGSLGGEWVRGEGFVYLEPDIEEAETLLGAATESSVVSVLVKDGAGVSGAAAQAGDLLESAGYGLLPMTYAENFPGVEVTQIIVWPEMADEARRIQYALGVGVIVEDPTSDAEGVVVVLGKDFGSVSEDSAEDTVWDAD